MKRAHRRSHVIIWLIVLPLTLAGLALAFLARKTPPVVPASESFGGLTAPTGGETAPRRPNA